MEKGWHKDWLLDITAMIIALAVVGCFVEIMRGKLHHWGMCMHGRRHDGSSWKEHAYANPKHEVKKSKEAATEEPEEEEKHFEAAA